MTNNYLYVTKLGDTQCVLAKSVYVNNVIVVDVVADSIL
jgi:hypothetical protein